MRRSVGRRLVWVAALVALASLVAPPGATVSAHAGPPAPVTPGSGRHGLKAQLRTDLESYRGSGGWRSMSRPPASA